MTTPTEMPPNFRAIPELDDGWRDTHPGHRVEEMRERGRSFQKQFLKDGPVRGVRTVDLLPFPYPVAFGFWQAAPNKAKYLIMRNRMEVIEFEDFSGQVRTLLVNPTEHDLSGRAPFFENARRELMPFVSEQRLAKMDGPVPKLKKLGLDPAKIDYITFDHLHVQDLRRGLLGENGRPPLYPNARLVVNRREIETLQSIHPLQRPWWIEGALDGVPPERILSVEGSVWLGKGVAIAWTPGHTLGNHTIVFHAEGRGVFTVSENGISPDSYVPERSKLKSLREYAKKYGAEVVMNGNALESTFSQYSSMILEKELAGRTADGVPQVYNSSPFIRTPMAWGIGPTFTIDPVNTGSVTKAKA
ncbi:MAG: hypothetical protein KIT79_09085 [Deltaproteobacteria bacterium]|nr:hypothetical protein [Deltaproteobacteria bacterium]